MVATKVPFADLDAVAVQAFKPDAMPWRALPPVFSHRHAPDRVLWPVAIRPDGVVGYETPRLTLETAAQEESVTLLQPPIPAAKDHRLVFTKDGWDYAHRDDLYARRSEELRARLSVALQKLGSGCTLDELQDAFDAAFLVDRWSLIATTLRAGAASMRRDEDPDWYHDALTDLDRCEEFCASLDTVLSHPLASTLPDQHRQSLFREALYALIEWRGNQASTWLFPISKQWQREAAAFAIFHAEHPEETQRIPHAVLRDALRGDPNALDVVRSELRTKAAWSTLATQSWEGLLGHGDFDRVMAVASAAVVDRRRFAQNLYRLELGAGKRDRYSAWRNFLRRSRPFSRFRAMAAWQQGEALANALREELALGAGIASMRGLVDGEVGAFVGVLRFPANRSIAAATAPRAAPPCIFANDSARPDGRRRLLNRFSIAHELAHLILDREENSCDWSCVLALDEESTPRSHAESRANAFASYFLAPRDVVCESIPRPEGDARSDTFVNSAMELRRTFGLSIVAAGEHLANCYEDLRPHKHRALPHDVRARLRAAAQGEPVTGFEADEELDPEQNGVPRLYSSRYARLVALNRRASILDDETAQGLLSGDPDANE
jgi:Zn-dependent peptidase ImmA (M78 family)